MTFLTDIENNYNLMKSEVVKLRQSVNIKDAEIKSLKDTIDRINSLNQNKKK